VKTRGIRVITRAIEGRSSQNELETRGSHGRCGMECQLRTQKAPSIQMLKSERKVRFKVRVRGKRKGQQNCQYYTDPYGAMGILAQKYWLVKLFFSLAVFFTPDLDFARWKDIFGDEALGVEVELFETNPQE
jgi:hypothetical protein